jgi:hypothetical protein
MNECMKQSESLLWHDQARLTPTDAIESNDSEKYRTARSIFLSFCVLLQSEKVQVQ